MRRWDEGNAQPNSRLRRRIRQFEILCGAAGQAELFAQMAAERDRRVEAERDALLDAAMARAARTLGDGAEQRALF